MWILNLGKPVNIPVLNEAMAIELGANLLGEGIIFIIASAILIGEYYRSSVKEAKKEQAKKAEIEQLQRTMQELYFTMEKQTAQIRELTRNMNELESNVVQKPWASKKPKPHTPSDEAPPSEPPSGAAPPTLSGEPILTLEELETNAIPVEENKQKMVQANLLLAAVDEIQRELFTSGDDRRKEDDGIIAQALNYIYSDVYRLSLRM